MVVLLNEGEISNAAKEFRTVFVPEVRKFYLESAQTAPKRYLDDCSWNEKVRNLYVLTLRTAIYLNGGNVQNSRAGLESLREFFYKLNTDNKIYLAGDAIYAFRKELNRASTKGILTEAEIAALNSLKSNIFQAEPSAAMKAEKEKYEAEAKVWQDKADRILSLSSISENQIKQLQEATGDFYLKYGMDFK